MDRRRRSDRASAENPTSPADLAGLPLRFQTEFPSTVRAINVAVRKVLTVAVEIGCGRSGRQDVEIALREAMANAVLHGNSGDPEKKVLLRCHCDPSRGMLLTVRDQGLGFDPAVVPDPREAERIPLQHGRGIFLMRELMDHVEHREGGREVVLFKQRAARVQRPRRRKP